MESLRAQTDDLAGQLDTLVKSTDQHVAGVGAKAQQQTQATGGKQILKRQLQSLKATLLSLGQKEAFTEAIKTYSHTHNYKPEADRAQDAVEAAEEDLKELKKANQQDEEQLRQLVQTIAQTHSQCQAIISRTNKKLSLSQHELQNHLASQAQQAEQEAQARAGAEASVTSVQLAEENARATALESQIATAHEATADMAGEVEGHLREISLMQEELSALQASQAQTERQEEQQLAWCRELEAVLVSLTGVRLIQASGDMVQLSMSVAGHNPQSTSAGGGQHASYTLSMRVEPGTDSVQSAELDPPIIDITPQVQHAQQHAAGSLQLLVSLVRGALHGIEASSD